MCGGEKEKEKLNITVSGFAKAGHLTTKFN